MFGFVRFPWKRAYISHQFILGDGFTLHILTQISWLRFLQFWPSHLLLLRASMVLRHSPLTTTTLLQPVADMEMAPALTRLLKKLSSVLEKLPNPLKLGRAMDKPRERLSTGIPLTLVPEVLDMLIRATTTVSVDQPLTFLRSRTG
jgi:hypothetical protein